MKVEVSHCDVCGALIDGNWSTWPMFALKDHQVACAAGGPSEWEMFYIDLCPHHLLRFTKMVIERHHMGSNAALWAKEFIADEKKRAKE